MKARIVGAIAHGRKDYFRVLGPGVPHDTNTTWSIILDIIEDVLKTEGKLPPNLYIQMDNTSSDNKTLLTLLICDLLVEAKIFQKVRLGFLPVGHTHEDIDQRFGVLARHLMRNVADTMDDLEEACKKAFAADRETDACILKANNIYDFREYLKLSPEVAALAGSARKRYNKILAGFTLLHCFLFSSTKQDHNGRVIIHTKRWQRLDTFETTKYALQLEHNPKLRYISAVPHDLALLGDIVKEMEKTYERLHLAYSDEDESASELEDAASDGDSDQENMMGSARRDNRNAYRRRVRAKVNWWRRYLLTCEEENKSMCDGCSAFAIFRREHPTYKTRRVSQEAANLNREKMKGSREALREHASEGKCSDAKKRVLEGDVLRASRHVNVLKRLLVPLAAPLDSDSEEGGQEGGRASPVDSSGAGDGGEMEVFTIVVCSACRISIARDFQIFDFMF